MAPPLSTPQTSFFYTQVVDGTRTRQGPLSKQEVQNLWDLSTLNSKTLVWRKGMQQWTQIAALPCEFREPKSTSAPKGDRKLISF
jgi:hypothetical protein